MSGVSDLNKEFSFKKTFPPNKTPSDYEMTFGEFLSRASDSDLAFLPGEDTGRLLPTCCAMANGDGGWVVWGVKLKDNGLPVAEGLSDAASLEKKLAGILQSGGGGENLVSYFRRVSDDGKKILAGRVEPANWRALPVRSGSRAYRRVEGENVISGTGVRWRMALDALETSRDDYTVPGLTMAELDEESAASFRERLTEKFPRLGFLSMEDFLKRTLVLDEDGGVTRAGELLLGDSQNLFRVRVSGDEGAEVHNISNLWSACEFVLPRILSGLTAPCASALRECFINAALHAEHDAGVIQMELGDELAVFSNPGLPRSLAGGRSEARNYRLMRIFVMAGLAGGEGAGLGTIREYDEKFKLFWNMLELATVSVLRLSAAEEENEEEPDTPDSGGRQKREPVSYGWMPVVREKLARAKTPPRPEPPVIEEPSGAADATDVINVINVIKKAELLPEARDVREKIREEEAREVREPDDVQEIEETGAAVPDEIPAEDDEYLGTGGEDGDAFSPLVNKVRNTPRMPPDEVREAILELCAEYRSLADLASGLARSEGSLRRHYVTSMVREGLLEMEFPDRVGHPDQRYRSKN